MEESSQQGLRVDEQAPERESAATQVAALTIGNFAAVGLLLLLDVLLARTLLPEEYGTYRQVRLFYNIVGPMFTLALPFSILYFLPRLEDIDERKQFILQNILLLVGLGVVLAIATFALSPLIARLFSNPELTATLRLFSSYPLFDMAVTFIPTTLIALDRTRRAAIYLVIRAALSLAFVLVALALATNVNAIILGLVVGACVNALFGAILLRPVLSPISFRSFRFANLRRQLSYALPIGMGSNVGRIAYQVDQIVVSMLFSPASYAVYVVGATEIPLVSQLKNNITLVLMSRSSTDIRSGRLAEAAARWRAAMRRTATLFFPLFVLLEYVAADAIVFVFSDTYADSVPIFRIYLFLLPLRIAAYNLLLQSAGLTNYDIVGSIVFLAGNAFLSPVLALTLGILGPPIATVTVSFLVGGFYLLATRRKLDIGLFQLIPVFDLFVRLLVAAAPCLLLFGLSSLLVELGTFARLATNCIAYAAVYVILVALLLPNEFNFYLGYATRTLRRIQPTVNAASGGGPLS
jgi:O-antigen/teichoic acid export membrane protein